MAFPTFSPGDVLNASDMNAVGLWLVKTQTIGTTVASVTVSDVFSADYEHYRIVLNGGVASTGIGINMTLGATATGYYSARWGHTYANAATALGVTNATSWAGIGTGSSTILSMVAEVYGPFAAKNTIVTAETVFADTSTGLARVFAGHLADTTSYTAFTLTTSTGTMTGGTIRVYGYRN